MPKVAIIDYQMGNLGSVRRAFEECGADVRVVSDPRELEQPTHLVLPGVGAFGKGMQHLREGGWVERIRAAVLEDRLPFFGICLGMQLLCTKGYEGGEQEGLNLIAGDVKRLEGGSALRIPHVGWNEVKWEKASLLAEGIRSGTDYYFVHSYHFVPRALEDVLATTDYGGPIVSMLERGNIFGAQFHPEKSQKPGFQLIRNFLRAEPC